MEKAIGPTITSPLSQQSPNDTDATNSDVESQKVGNDERVPHWKVVWSQSLITETVLKHRYHGAGTEDDPYLVEFIPDDPRNPMNFPDWKKWALIACVALTTLAVAFVSTAYTGTIKQIIEHFECSREVATLGISLFVLGWALGPLIWAPLSELYGRQYIFFVTYAMVTVFNAGAATVQNIESLIIIRFLAGIWGASPMVNAGGVVADLLPANQRGLGMVIFASAPFLGPVIGPVVGGFAAESIGWRWVLGIMAIFTGVLWIFGALLIPETYAPVILKRRAADLSQRTGKVYVSILEKRQGKVTAKAAFRKAIIRPWQLLFREPIVLLLSIYMAIIYGTLYMLFGAFPVVFQEKRGWSQGVGGLAFCGLAIGIIIGLLYCVWDNKRYRRAEERASGNAAPEVRLPPTLISAVLMPIGVRDPQSSLFPALTLQQMFWFAFSNSPRFVLLK
jgi:multidrug resistance protein